MANVLSPAFWGAGFYMVIFCLAHFSERDLLRFDNESQRERGSSTGAFRRAYL